MQRIWRLLAIIVMMAGLLPLVPVGTVVANDAVVSVCDEAHFDAALVTVQSTGGGTITFSCTGTITFTSQKTITSDVTIIGGGTIIFDGNDSTRLFFMNPGASLELVRVTLQSGNSAGSGNGSGGAIYNWDGTLTVTGSTFSGNNTGFFASSGGAIYNENGALTITTSTFSGNSAVGGGAIHNTGMTTVIASAFSSNSATNSGGAIYNFDEGTLTIIASTFSENNAPGGGAVFNHSSTLTVMNSTFSDNEAVAGSGGAILNSGTLTVTSSTFSGNIAAVGATIVGTANLVSSILANTISGDNCAGTITSQGSNLSDDASCNLIAAGDQPSTDPLLGPLQNNGGPTLTHLLQPGSPAIDAALNCATATDQRGISRPQGPACDIGSVEVEFQQATYPLCASYYTGTVTSPLAGGCGRGQIELSVPGNLSFCIDRYTGRVLYLFGRPCAPPRWIHILPDDGDLLTCVSLYTTANRWVPNHSRCTAYELPNTIPASP